ALPRAIPKAMPNPTPSPMASPIPNPMASPAAPRTRRRTARKPAPPRAISVKLARMARRRRNDVQRAWLRRRAAETRPWSDFRSRLHRRPRLVSGRLPASIDDLKGHADLFDGKITGIESGAGETEIVKNELIPDYGLEDEYTHWAYNKFAIKDLKDPRGAMGEPEKLHIMASED